ncbi:hypothetical protein [Ramlibacter sp. Leaf400]|uniref:hypothetical protein n=1 Tax=Ramlibacter sp. Leaf400 TaxID=1736365 RepID=UPI000701BD71|nr:hypothetical protein [Ramlibacter sp. Leaf400]KQT13514.1 hypothetical protein ASG30_18980 [Ramlibacter sp. Leaf400]
MARLRFLLACLLLAALPVQGWAATVLSCGPAQHSLVARAQAQQHGQHSHDAGAACAAACSTVALAGEAPLLFLDSAPDVLLGEPFLRFASRPAPVSDKLPRA